MNLSKKRKLATIVTLSVMIVAVVATACILTVPNFYRGGEDIVPTNTAAYGMKAPAYNNSTASMVYVSMQNGSDDGDIRVLFPNTIYLDKTESLSDAGYYILYNTWSNPSSGDKASTVVFDSVLGYYASGANAPAENANKMSSVFNGYSFSRSLLTSGNGDNIVGGNGTELWEKNGASNSGVEIQANKGYNVVIKNLLSGSIKDSSKNYIGNDAVVGDSNFNNATFEFKTGNPIGYLRWYGYEFGSGTKWRDIDATVRTEFSGGSGKFYGDMSSIGLSNFTSTSYANNIRINIHIYDKSELNTAVANFNERMLTESNKSVLNKITGNDDAYNAAKAYYDEARTCLITREVNQKTINDYTKGLNNYVFELENFSEQNLQDYYDGNAVNISKYWTRYDNEFYNLDINGTTYGTEIKNADNNQPKTYNLKVSPKSSVTLNAGTSKEVTLRFRWKNTKNNEYKSIGSFTVNPAEFQVSGLQKVVQQFKNENYDITLASASTTGALNDNNFPGFVLPNQNARSIYLVVDEAGKDISTIDWTGSSSAVSVNKDVGTYTVYYKVTAPNHKDYIASFVTEITKATITLQFDVYDHTYGDAVLTSDQIVDNMLSKTKIFNATTWGEDAKNYLKAIFNFTVDIPAGFIDSDGFVIVRNDHYTVNYAMKADNPYAENIETVTVVENSNRNAYHVNPRPVTIQWNYKNESDMYYNGSGNKRPEVVLVGSDNFVGNSSTSLSLDIVGQGQHPDGTIVPLVGHEAIYAGKYEVKVTCTNPNYMVDSKCDTTKKFDILQRPITVVLKDREREYAKETTAPNVWKNYIETLFPANLNNAVYTVTSVASGNALVETAPSVFEIGLNVTDNDYTSKNDAEKYYKVNEAGYDLTLTCINKNYIFTDDTKGAKFYVTPAPIDLDLQTIASKVYNGAEQEILMPNNNTVVTLRGYEAAHRESVEILYSATQDGTYSSTPLTMKDFGSMEVWYKVTADNHKENNGHFTAQITKAHIYVDVTKKASATYGDELPTSEWLIENLGITFTWSNEANKFDFSNEMEFVLLDVTDRRANVGDYSVTYSFKEEKYRENYIIDYVRESANVYVYTINPKPLYIEWSQSGDNWSEDGKKYTYDGNTPVVRPVAPDMYDGKENVVVIDDGNRDNISLSPIVLTGSVKGTYTATTSLTNSQNAANYTLVNPSADFEVVARRVEIYVQNQTATYGNAYTVPLGRALVSPTDANAMWAYANSDNSAHFIGDHYSSYCLTSDARRAEGEPLVDAGEHEIRVEPLANANADITKNYEVSVVKEGAPDNMQAIFEITPVDIHYMGRQFNIDADKKDEEQQFVTAEQIKERIYTSYGTPISEFSVRMTDLYKNDGTEDVEFSESLNFVSKTSVPESVGRYYVWVEIKHRNAKGNCNYNVFTAKVEVNILTGWISIVISEGIKNAEYGEKTHSSQKLVDELVFSEISGIPASDTPGDYKGFEDALADLKKFVADGNVTFFVGVGNTADKMTDNLSYGDYSIYIEVKDSFEYQNFRFLPKNSGDVHTSNINAYKVGKRYIDIDWGEMDEVYGEHGDTSNSHTYTLKHLYGDDKVDVNIAYYMLVGDNIWQPVGGHVKNVGTYKAVVEGVSHNDYQLPETTLETVFQVTARPITLDIVARELVYGLSVNATRGGVNDFLNRAIEGQTFYSIASSSEYNSFAYREDASNIFRFKIGDYTLADGLNYLSAGTYDILAESINDNYNISYTKAGVLTVTKSTGVSYGQQQIGSATYNGGDIKVAPENVLNNISLAGDGAKLNSGVTVEYKLADDDVSKYSADYAIESALRGVYSVNIKVDAPNHEIAVFTVSFIVERAVVVINMKSTTKIYGDTEDELFAQDGEVNNFSDWLKKHCQIEIKAYDEKGNDITVAGLEDDFVFKVIQKGQGNGDALAVGKNPIGTYRVYHCNNDTLEDTKYIIDYYQAPDAEAKCNAEAYEIIKREARVNWEFNGAIDVDNHKFEYSNSAHDIKAYITLVGESVPTSVPTTSLARGSYSDKERAIAINVGLYTEKVEVDPSFALYAQLGNYYFTNDTFDFEIVAKKATVTIKNQSFTYGAEATKVGEWKNHIEYQSDVEFVGQPIQLTVVATTDKTYYNVGKYHIVGQNSSPNYEVTFKGEGSNEEFAIFEVTAATIGINLAKHSVEYNGKTFSANVKNILASENAYTIVGDWNDAKVTYKQADGQYSSAIPTVDGVTGSEGFNIDYRIELANHITQDGTITIEVRPASVVIKISKGATSVYGDDLLSSDKLFEMTNATLDSDASSINVDIKTILTLKVDASGKVNVGTYNIEAQLLPEYSNLYTVRLVDEVDAYEVTARELKVTWNYTDAFEYDGNRHIVTATLEGVLTGDSVEVGNYQGNSGVNAGSYTAIAAGLTNSNYTLGKDDTRVWKIAPKAIEVDWVAGDFTYNGETHNLDTPTIKENQLVSNDSCDIIVVAKENVKAGTHTATAEAVNKNYVIKNSSFNFVIKPAPISITWDETALTYNGTEQAPTAIVVAGQLFGDDECKVVVSGAKENAGENYKATATLDNPNYIIADNATKAFSIAKKAITFTWMEQTKNLTYTGEQQLPTAVAVGAVEGDVVEFEITVGNENDGINVGEYTAVVTGVKSSNPNYVIDTIKQTSMSTNYTIVKGTNEFISLTAPDKMVDKLPWSDSDKPQSKWGEVVVKYYTDAACTQELTDITSAGEGTYWVVVSVAGTNNYDEISQTFEVALEGGLNIVIVIVGAIVSLVLLVGALVVVKLTNKKKQQGGAV